MRRAIAAAACMAAMLWTGAAAAQSDGSATVKFEVLEPNLAVELAQKTRQDCLDRGYQVAVAVVDRFGVMQAMVRSRFAGPHTVETARQKAYTAVSFRTDTLSLDDVAGEQILLRFEVVTDETVHEAGLALSDGVLLRDDGIFCGRVLP